ncbi:MAG: DNA-directed RNA polymerase subunit delta [Syntrophomonadaceae bacterium]|nr:DNA-directed RNA polymerase subunit delta [Syntrophomonadaceae bacterium]
MIKRKKSEADWAVEILTEQAEPMYYLDLLKMIAARMQKKDDVDTLNSIYTRINLDNRLVYQGEGCWYYDTSRMQTEHR